MAAYNKFNITTQNMLFGVHNFNTDTIKWMLTNTAPVATNAVKTDITEITAGNGYAAGGVAGAITPSNSSGTEKIVMASGTVTATGAVGPFRYVVVYDDTPTSPAKPLICWFDYGSSISLANTDTFQFVPDATNGLFQLA